MGAENVNPQQELTRLDEQIQSTSELAALKAIFARLNEIMQAFPDDFEVQLAGNEIKQRLMARGSLLKQQAPAPEQPSVLTSSFLDTASRVPVAKPEPPTPLPLRFPVTPPSDSGSLTVPPPALAAKPGGPPARPAATWNRAVLVVPIAGLVVALVCIVWAALVTHKRHVAVVNSTAAVDVNVVTAPAGASVKAVGNNKTATCTSNCKLMLTPGAYQISASLAGFDPVAGPVNVVARQAATVNLSLRPQAQSVRLLTDLAQGKVVVDDAPPADLQEGQLVLDRVAPGTHTVKITGPNGEASFSFEIGAARMPAVAGPVSAKNMVAVLVSSFGKQARVVTNAGPWKFALNGQPQPDAGPAGTDLTGFQPGVNEIVVGDGHDQRNMSETFGSAPMLTAFVKTDVNAGTLIVSTGQDGVRVFLNDKEYKRQTQRGQLRIPTLGKVTVKVAKNGFQEEPAQSVEVKKGAEVRLQFNLRPQPQFGSLEMHGAMPGSEVLVDQKAAGSVGPDGSFNLSALQPGDHTIELRHDQFVPKRLQRSFRAGQAVVLGGADVTLAAAVGTVRLINRTPATATITYRRGEEAEAHEFRGNQMELPPGNYAFSAGAPGFTESTTHVQLAAGENREIAVNLAHEKPAAPPPAAESGMAEFEDAQGWKKDGANWVHKGGGFVPYKLPTKGIFTFTVELLKGGGVFRAGQVRWCVEYIDSKNYLLFEIDRKNFWAGVIQKGQRLERVKASHNIGNQKAFTIQIEVTADRLVTRERVGGEWKVLDTFAEPGRDYTQGKFGFLIQGNDEIAISDFKFLPK